MRYKGRLIPLTVWPKWAAFFSFGIRSLVTPTAHLIFLCREPKGTYPDKVAIHHITLIFFFVIFSRIIDDLALRVLFIHVWTNGQLIMDQSEVRNQNRFRFLNLLTKGKKLIVDKQIKRFSFEYFIINKCQKTFSDLLEFGPDINGNLADEVRPGALLLLTSLAAPTHWVWVYSYWILNAGVSLKSSTLKES